eukprot:7272_1
MGNTHHSITKQKTDAFIMQFNKSWCGDQSTGVEINVSNRTSIALEMSCSKRVIFISLTGLAMTYRKCPPHVLYSALLIMPLKRKWIYSSKYVTQLNAASSGLLRKDASTKEFVQLLKWKDSQGLVLWGKDEYETSSKQESNLVHPFWQEVSNHLVSLYDPITNGSYKPIQFDDEQKSDIVTELYFATLKFKSIKSILNHSNPKSFRVMTSYCESDNAFIRMETMDDSESSEWWISPDYF